MAVAELPWRTEAGRLGWRAFLGSPATALLALDFDGTIAPIVADPMSARPHPRMLGPLRSLLKSLGTVAVLTGRPAAMTARLLSADTDPELSQLVVLGSYGLERWSAETGVASSMDDASRAAVDGVRLALPGLLRHVGAPPDVFVEDKDVAIALHVRRTADPAAAMRLLREPLTELAGEYGLRLEPGRLVLELRPRGIDKGVALETLVGERAATAVSYAGDDLGDLAAFQAVDRLRLLGTPGVLICSGSDEVAELRERADLVVDGPAGIATLLEEIQRAINA